MKSHSFLATISALVLIIPSKGKSTTGQRTSTSVNLLEEREASESPLTQGTHTRSQCHSFGHPVRPLSPSPSVDLVENPKSFSQHPSVTNPEFRGAIQMLTRYIAT
ncbi:hypothetical protein HAX54_022943 [Datura stramonium]|uniref:Uncharacterized protein n=1 Tax=Datura stramonium TaxID=4076 RepID=A0ABS8UY94_DATST|nr:hypothetical protein [Datura stramonium]